MQCTLFGREGFTSSASDPHRTSIIVVYPRHACTRGLQYLVCASVCLSVSLSVCWHYYSETVGSAKVKMASVRHITEHYQNRFSINPSLESNGVIC